MGVCCACLIIFSAGPREEACSFRDNQNQKKNTPPPIGDGTVLWLQDVLANVISKPFVNVISKPFVNIPSARARPVLLMYLWRVMNVHVMYINVYMVKENLFKKKMFIVKVPCYKHSHFSPCESRVSESVI